MNAMSITETLARFGRCRSGGVALQFALLIIPITITIGGVSDYYTAQGQKERLAAIVDAAALAAVNQQNLQATTDVAKSSAKGVFDAGVTQLTKLSVGTVTIDVTDNGLQRSSKVTATATAPTAFLQIFGTKKLTMNVQSSAVGTFPTYIDFYLLLDNTPSMGVAATTADIDKMQKGTINGYQGTCAFACHDLSNPKNDYYSLAKKLGVTTRIDVLRSATQQLMDTAKTMEAANNQFRMAIYTFGASATKPVLTEIAPLTADLSTAKTQAAAIDLMTVPNQGYNNDMTTDFDGVLAGVNGVIPNPGSGTSPSATPQKVLFFVSDGVADFYYPTTCSQPTLGGGRCEEPLNTATCTAIKNRGIKIAVLYTTYLPLPSNGWYVSTVQPFSNQISPSMQACASPGLFFEVSPSGGISDAMTALFQKTVLQARITN